MEDGFRGSRLVHVDKSRGLNPCSCGRWLQSPDKIVVAQEVSVLILVLVEDGFRALRKLALQAYTEKVLILVLVEDGFRDYD